ncbi:hypothetical protein [Microbacterium kyungheense]|uniref:Uncharacterized protein n=1 Tax=Microbacterium kyungheense TaxID=1263636 RepID=A0A543EFH7_9MICO|nr:hypothetical protein [Microbacterium kyungheense]TQM20330.1 hypothetical protein FB391_3468 [Microbacterium kyungheense]
MTSSNERAYARLLRWYPRWWRDIHGHVVLTTLLDVDEARGRTGPTSDEAWALRWDGLQHRWRGPARASSRPGSSATAVRRSWVRTTTLLGVASVLTIAIGGWVASRDSVTGSGSGRTLDALLQHASEYERAILMDGVVTPAEYARALIDWRDCVSSAGAQPSEIYPIADNQLTFDYEITAATDEARVGLEVTAETCLPEYFDAVGAWWVEQDPRPVPSLPLASE